MDPLIAAKLAPPRLQVHSVPRHYALERLRQALGGRAAFIAAPAGYGKTELLVQWWHACQADATHRLAWLSLDADDADPATFLAYALAALGERPQAMALASTPGSARSAVARLLADAEASRPTLLMLDDWERVGPALDGLLALLVERLPAHWHVVIASREPPGPPLAAHAAQGRLVELGMAELRMGFAEASQLLAPAGGEEGLLRLSEGDVAFLLERTDGWPMALHLARAYVHSPAQGAAPLLAFSGRAGELARYLTGAVWQAMSPADQDALMTMACLPRTCGALLDHLTGRRDGAAWLAALARRAVPLARLDTPGLWFQLHPLLVDHLMARLATQQPERRVQVQAQAAQWMAAHGWLPEALRLAAAAGQPALVAQLLDAAGHWRLAFDGRIDLLRQHLATLPPALVLAHPRLALARGLLLLKSPTPTGAAQWLAALAQAHPALRDDPELAAETQLVHTVVHAYTDVHSDMPTDGHRDARALASPVDLAARFAAWRAALAGQPLRAPDALLEGALANMHAYALASVRRHAEAERACAEALALLEPAGLAYNAAFVRFVQIGLALDQAQLARADALLDALAPAIASAFGHDSDLAAVADMLLAWLRVLQGEADAAAGLLDGALGVLESHDAWYEVCWAAYAALVGAALLRGDAPAARAALARGQTTAAQRGMRRLGLRLAIWHHALALAGLIDTAPERPAAGWAAAAAAHSAGDRHLADAAALLDAQLAHRAGAADAEALWRAQAEAAQAGGAWLAATEAWAALAAAQAASPHVPVQAQAPASLARALALAAPCGLVWPLLQAGPALWPLLERALAQRSSRSGSDAQAQWLARVRAALAQMRQRPRAQPAHPLGLSAREAEVAARLCQGLSNKLIARELGVTERTVKFHLAHLFTKLGVHTRAEAVSRLSAVATRP